MARIRLPLLFLLVCLALAAPAAGTAAPAPELANPNATGRTLVVRFFTLLVKKDRAGLEAFLAPNFQVQRADGSGSGKTSYLAKLPATLSFKIQNVVATEANGALVVRYKAVATGMTNGKKYTPGPAPRLSTFTWDGSKWQLSSHANFNPLTG
ncbi:MAG TPA: nuclear transport factor 2 family protein [Gaiellaceae bacterium]